MKYYFAWLGSKRAAKRDVAEPGVLLDRAAQARLPVPAGGILLDNFFELAVNEGLVQVKDGQVTAVSPQALYDLLFNLARFPQLEEAVVIRPLSPGGFGPSSQPVQMHEPTSLAASLCEGWRQQNGRHDLLLITLPQSELAGTAVSPTSAEVDEIRLPAKNFALPRLHRWQKPDGRLPPHARRLQLLLRGLRRTFGDSGWAVEWRDDGRICWLWELTRSRTGSP